MKKLNGVVSFLFIFTMILGISNSKTYTMNISPEQEEKLEELTRRTDNPRNSRSTEEKTLFDNELIREIKREREKIVAMPPEEQAEYIRNICNNLEHNNFENDWHFDPRQFTKENLVQRDGFQEINIESIGGVNQQGQPDGKINIKGLFLDRGAESRATIIFIPGFLPGKKENFAPFVRIAPQDCNLLFAELRNHGESGGTQLPLPCLNEESCFGDCCNPSSCCGNAGCLGLPNFLSPCGLLKKLPFFLTLGSYGILEMQDIISVIQHTVMTTQKPVILFGWCAGAFLAARSLIALRQGGPQLAPLYRFVAGLMFDSGFGSIREMIPAIYREKDEKMLPRFFDKLFCDRPNRERNANQPNAQNQPAQEAPQNNEESPIDRLIRGYRAFIRPAANLIRGAKDFVKEQTLRGARYITTALLRKVQNRVEPQMTQLDPETRLYGKMNLIRDIPIFVIHSQNDQLSPWNRVEPLVQELRGEQQ